MPEAMDTAAPSTDLSALAWVHGELRRSLDTANKALRRYLKEADATAGSDIDAVDPAVLRTARTHLHQGVGALELVGMPAVADVLRASEAAVQRMIARPAIVDAAAVDTIERVSFGLLDFLARQLAGKPVSPVMLFPQYRAAQQLAAADRVHPADLWKIDWQWRDLPPDAHATPRNADDEARGDMETLVLALMRPAAAEAQRLALARMSDLCADLGAGARFKGSAGTHLAAFWQLAAAVFEAQARGLLVADNYVKRIASRLMAQLRTQVRGQDDISDRLAQDLLFFCSHARAPDDTHAAPRLAAVRQAFRLADQPTADYETPRLGRFDPAVMALARKRVAAAKDSWSAVAGGEMHRMTGLAEQFTLVGESVQRLFPGGETLAQALQTAVTQTVASGSAPPPGLAMEVATSVLYLDASLEDGEFDHPELPERVQSLARRIDDVRIGAEPQPLDSWMEELYRRVSDRQTMGSVVQELRASLSEIEKQIDQYFRDPSQRQVLIPVPAQLSAMRGVLSVLGLEQASAAALHMRDDVDALAQTEVDPQRAIQAGTFDRLADNLGALSFLIDMLSVQPGLAKSLFRFDPETGSLSAVMGQSERVSAFAAFDEATAPAPLPAPEPVPPLLEQLQAVAALAAEPAVADADLVRRIEPLAQQALAADQRELARLLGSAQAALRGDAGDAERHSVRLQLAQALAALGPPPVPELPATAPVPPERAPVPGGTGLEDDAEMRDIFIEEAREVVADAAAALERLADAPDNATDMTAVRRAFHTLKGSARMVGLREFGDAGWACEQLYNARLAQAPRMDLPLRLLTAEALHYMGEWTEAIADGVDRGHSAATVARAADALRLDGVRLSILAPGAVPTRPSAAMPLMPPLTVPALLEPEPEPEPELAPEPEQAPIAADMLFGDLPAPGQRPEPVEEPAPLPALEPLAPLVPLEEAALELTPEQWAAFDTGQALPAAAAAPAPEPVLTPQERLEFDFEPEEEPVAPATETAAAATAAEELELPAFDDFELESEVERTLVLPTLTERVPDLPSAADLDLGPPAPPAEAVPEAEASFELDLSAFEEVPAAEAAALVDLPLDAPLPPAALPDSAAPPVPEGEALEIDLADLGELFAPELGAEPAPVAAEAGTEADFELDLSDEPAAPNEPEAMPEPEAEPEPVAEPVAEPVSAPEPEPAPEFQAADEEEQVKVIGPLRIGIPLFNIYLNEADELSRRLVTELAEWSLEDERHAVPETSVALAHSLAGSSATVGYADLSALSRALEHALMRSRQRGRGQPGEAALFSEVAEEIRRLLHQFAAGFLRPVAPDLIERLAAVERLPLPPAEPLSALAAQAADAAEAAEAAAADEADTGDAVDALDDELFPIFEEEADELLPQLQARLRDWLDRPAEPDAPTACMRTLHTFKGGARLAGAMRLGERAHRLETAIEQLGARGGATLADIEPLLAQADAMSSAYEALRKSRRALPEPAAAPAAAPVVAPVVVPAVAPPPVDQILATAEPVEAGPAPEPEPESEAERTLLLPPPAVLPPPVVAARAVDWARFTPGDSRAAVASERPAPSGAVVRVRAGLLDRLVNDAGEVSITRARIDADVKQLQNALGELTDSLERMRRQLRDIELQAETQITSRIEAAKAASQSFDPLEMDRFTRFQELTRFMAESVNDVATLQRGLQRTLQSTEDELAAQARLTRELQDDLLRTRMVEFESMADRLYRTARAAAKETGKQVRLDIVGGAIEIDRGVLERMAGPFEHLLRNSVAHGIESPEARTAAGKEAAGAVTITVAQSGNEVAVEFADDGGGLDLGRIRARGVERGLLAPEAQVSDEQLSQLIFQPGFSTADTVTELAGRGVGLDVVRAEVNGMGGRIETASEPGRGTRFKLLLPLTTAVTQVVMLRCAELSVAVPSTLIELVRRVPSAEVERAYEAGWCEYGGEQVPFFWLPALLSAGTRGEVVGRTQSVVIVRSAAQRVAVHVDEVVGNQEVVVKNVGPQLARLPGLAGVTLLPSGQVALIYNPVALATVYGEPARARMRQGVQPVGPQPAEAEAARAPMVMVVDDSLTVRRVTQRLLVREGYRVVLAKDGLDALERLAEERPAVLLSDIEMPRMDGFDLVRNVRADPRLADLPVVMITSRIAQKHRDYAAELGVDHYLGKPYSEEELLSLVARYAGADIPDILA
jgi:chemosensory pili system protein ChpA (sensor histidine kinase/response regulator)